MIEFRFNINVTFIFHANKLSMLCSTKKTENTFEMKEDFFLTWSVLRERERVTK
jgi:hypothetical protein